MHVAVPSVREVASPMLTYADAEDAESDDLLEFLRRTDPNDPLVAALRRSEAVAAFEPAFDPSIIALAISATARTSAEALLAQSLAERDELRSRVASTEAQRLYWQTQADETAAQLNSMVPYEPYSAPARAEPHEPSELPRVFATVAVVGAVAFLIWFVSRDRGDDKL